MKLLQVVVAVLTVLLFLARQNVFAGVCPVKPQSSGYHDLTCSSPLARGRDSSASCARARGVCVRLSLPKHKKDPKIRVDNEDIDYPIE